MKEKALIQIAESAEPAKRESEENESGNISEQQISQPAMPRILAGKPDRYD